MNSEFEIQKLIKTIDDRLIYLSSRDNNEFLVSKSILAVGMVLLEIQKELSDIKTIVSKDGK